MNCASCQGDNPEGHRFFGHCGAPLNAVCAACGFDNPPGDKFCGGCGTALAGATPQAPAPASKAAPVREAAISPMPKGERRQVTVLFVDLTKFTALSESLDMEETHALLNHYFDKVDALVENYGGSIDKHIGDAVMAVFGAPIGHSNDPERAVRAAFDIQAAVAALEAPGGQPLSCHIGLASGQVVVSGTGSAAHQEYTIIGDTVNLASRLQDIAGAGEIAALIFVFPSGALTIAWRSTKRHIALAARPVCRMPKRTRSVVSVMPITSAGICAQRRRILAAASRSAGKMILTK